MIDMLDMTDQQLNMDLEILLGAKEDRHRKGNVIKGDYSTSPKDYCADPAASLEVQAEAIEVDEELYIKNLADTTSANVHWDGYEGNMPPTGVAWMVSASPRERAEAAYMTLSSKD